MPIDTSYICITEEALEIERKQAIDEGKDFERVEKEFKNVREMVSDAPKQHQGQARELLDTIKSLPIREGYEYHEPANLAEIHDSRPEGQRLLKPPNRNVYDHILGGWLGRCAGCLLGKPVEGWMTERIHGLLKELEMYPLREYLPSRMPESVWRKFRLDEVAEEHLAFADEIDHMVRDDDLDYTIANLDLLRDNRDFDPDDVASYWLGNIPLYGTYTAERAAYRNVSNLILPPDSATHQNPYREGIGAQIRADALGYTHIALPERAAELAWRDAQVSHVKNGIYGEMWVAAMLAAALSTSSMKEVVRIGLSEIPENCRLSEGVEDVIGWYENNLSYRETITRIHNRWDEEHFYDWLHTVSNAQIITVSLLWGEGDFSRSIGGAVQAGFDTDCNGATVGSIIGLQKGASKLPSQWIKPLDDRIDSVLTSHRADSISWLAKESYELWLQNGK